MSHPARARVRPVAGNRRAATPDARADFDTLVIGAGQAGLAAGYLLFPSSLTSSGTTSNRSPTMP